MILNTFLKIGEKLVIQDLSDKLGLSSPSFIVLDILQGGMGTCAKIESKNKQHFALKIIHTSLLENKTALQRYIVEMKTWLTLSSCNGVVEALCITRVNDIPCIASKWMDKGNISPYINQTNAEFFYKSIDRIVSTLDWAFSKYSIIHRDLKPENILLDNENNAYIADWGLARSIAKGTEEVSFKDGLKNISNRIDLTDAGNFLGTILYASPEQILGLKSIDHRSDIYSLGCIMYEWETGRPPFIANTVQEIATQHLRLKPKQISGLFNRTNFKVGRIIEKCLEKNPDNRFQTYSELINSLNKVAVKESNFKKFIVEERYKTPYIGGGELDDKLKEKLKEGKHFENHGRGVIEINEIHPYLKEAENLMALGEYEKAKNIYKRFFIRDIFKEFPDLPIHQQICVNYALSLKYIGEINKSIFVLRTLDNSEYKPASYYLNLSLLYLIKRDNITAEKLCREGYKKYPNDSDILGNLTISLTSQEKLEEALQTATKRLTISRNVNSLEEIASVLNRIGDNRKNLEFPKAIENYKKAISYLQEAVKLNPNFESARLSIANTLYKLKKYGDSSKEAVHVCNNTQNRTFFEIGLFNVARNMHWTSEYESNVEFCNKWLKSYPESILLKRILSQTLFDGYVYGKVENGKRVTEQLILDFFTSIIEDEENRLPSDFVSLARYLEWIGGDENLELSISILKQGIALYPDYWKLDFTLGATYLNYHYPEDELKVAINANKKAPWRETTYYLLSAIYKVKGDTEKAAQYTKQGDETYAYKQKLYLS